jgi:hypothetical protein
MNMKKINLAIEILKDDLGDGLLAADIFAVDSGLSIAGYNPQPKASALFNMLTTNIMKTLRGARFPNLEKFYLLNLEGDKMAVVLPLGDYRFGILIDNKKVQLGVVVSIAIPNAIEAIEEALQ